MSGEIFQRELLSALSCNRCYEQSGPFVVIRQISRTNHGCLQRGNRDVLHEKGLRI
jgi:hypothetical protein